MSFCWWLATKLTLLGAGKVATRPLIRSPSSMLTNQPITSKNQLAKPIFIQSAINRRKVKKVRKIVSKISTAALNWDDKILFNYIRKECFFKENFCCVRILVGFRRIVFRLFWNNFWFFTALFLLFFGVTKNWLSFEKVNSNNLIHLSSLKKKN